MLVTPLPGADRGNVLNELLNMLEEPADIAEAIVFLLRSDFITGHVLYVDGGRHLLDQVQSS